MKKLTTSVLAVVLTASFGLVTAQQGDTLGTRNIQEVVITGALGIKRTADAVTSAQQVINNQQLNQAANPNPVAALTGKVTGLNITRANSQVDATTTITLRGARTITGSSQALIVIDGAISTADQLQRLPTDVIQSINVIKGAQGAALYGADGVNGVIIVTTTAGSKNKLSIEYQGSVAFDSPAFLPKRQQNYGQGIAGLREQPENESWGPAFNGEITPYGAPMYDFNGDGFITLNGIGSELNNTANPDNGAVIHAPYVAMPNALKNFFQSGRTTDNNVTINAGDGDRYFLLNLDNTRRDFIVKDDRSNKTSVLMKGGFKIGKLKVDGQFSYVRSNVNQTPLSMYDDDSTQQSLYWNLLQAPAGVPITAWSKYPDAGWAWTLFYNNPYWVIAHRRENTVRNIYNMTGTFEYDFNSHVNIRYTSNYRTSSFTDLQHRDAWPSAGLEFNGEGAAYVGGNTSAFYENKGGNSDYYGDLLLNFDYHLTDDLHLGVNIGHNYQEHKADLMFNGGQNLAMPGLYTMSNVTQPIPNSEAITPRTRFTSNSVFYNIDLGYKDFLFLNTTGRNDWTSLLSRKNHQNSYFYPSVGLSFIPSKAFNMDGDVLNYLKIAGNWTRVGNTSAVGPYSVNTLATLVPGFPFRGQGSFVNSLTPTDPNIKPEFVTTTEVDLSAGFLHNRVNLGVSLYNQDTDDLITIQTASLTSQINSYMLNIGKLRNRGAEIDLDLVPIRSHDFKWDVHLGYTYNETRIKKVLDKADEVTLLDGTIVSVVAQKNALYPLLKGVMFNRDKDGRIIVDPTNGLPTFTDGLVNAGVASPPSIYDFGTGVSYKGFNLHVVADYRTGHNYKFFASVVGGMSFNGTLWESGNYDRDKGYIVPNSVLPNGSANNIPVLGGGYAGAEEYFEGHYAADQAETQLLSARAFKIREISLSYTLPKSLVQQAGLQEVTLGVNAINPWTKLGKGNHGYADPEASTTATSFGFADASITDPSIPRRIIYPGYAGLQQYPPLKSFGFSLNVKF